MEDDYDPEQLEEEEEALEVKELKAEALFAYHFDGFDLKDVLEALSNYNYTKPCSLLY